MINSNSGQSESKSLSMEFAQQQKEPAVLDRSHEIFSHVQYPLPRQKQRFFR